MPAASNLSSTELETIFESVGEGAIVIDKHGRVIRANSMAVKLLGYKQKELIGHPFMSKVKALNADSKPISRINRPMLKTIITGQAVYEYVYYQSKSRSQIPVFVSASPVIQNGQPIGAVEIFRDISMEEAVDLMKSEFISLASHQLRTPLTSIKTYSHMLLDGYMGEIDDEKRPALEIIVASTNRMNELISTLLNITRLESGAIVVDENSIDIAKIAREVFDEIEITAKNHDVSLKLKIPENESTKIVSDGPLIKEILTNLISNSVKYSKPNGVVTLSVKPNPSFIVVTVKDSGLGIPEPAKSQIFSKFFRAHNVIQMETSGTGLGLYLVKGLIDELGGEISFTSQEDKGTTFTVKLPQNILVK